MERYSFGQFATYDAGSYGNCAYGTDTCASTSAGNSAGTTAGDTNLVNTGFMVVIIVTLACLLIVAALLVRFWRRSRKLAPEPAESDAVELIDARRGHY